MKKKWLYRILAALLALAAVCLIVRRCIPISFSDLIPELQAPVHCRVHAFDKNDGITVTGEELDHLLSLLESLAYRYDGRAPGGVMKGQLYHLSFFQQEPAGLFDIFVSNQLGIVYVSGRIYEMIGDPAPLLDLLARLK